MIIDTIELRAIVNNKIDELRSVNVNINFPYKGGLSIAMRVHNLQQMEDDIRNVESIHSILKESDNAHKQD